MIRKESEDPFVPRTISYGYHDTKTCTSVDARTEVRHHIKHLGLPQEKGDIWRYKKAYDLILEALEAVSVQSLSAAEYMLLFHNRFHIFHDEYPDSATLVETARQATAWAFFLTEDEDLCNVREYFDQFHRLLKSKLSAWEPNS